MKKLQELIVQAKAYQEQQGYSAKTMQRYRSAWNRFVRYCKEKEVDEPTSVDADKFIADIYPEEVHKVGHVVFRRNAIRRLFDLEIHGAFPKCYHVTHHYAPACFTEVCTDYENHLAQTGLKQTTISGKLSNAKKFFAFIADNELTCVSQLKPHHVYSYTSTIDSKTSVAKSAVLFFLRGFMRYLVESHDADKSLEKILPVILVNHSESLPSVYNSDEITKVINAINETGECTCRDRAVIMLAFQLGMRAGDIRNLKFNNIDWRLKSVTFIQEKTKKALRLPLPDECFFALLDYLKNERHDCDSEYIFVRSRAPYQAYSSSSSFYYVISECFARAGVDTNNKHKGLHSLRHSSAVNLLFNDTPYPVISGILGHDNANTTKRYLRMDVKHLRQLALEVPNVC